MLLDLSYHDKKLEKQLSSLVGKAYSFWERLKMGGVGSQRFIISNASPEFLNLLEKDNRLNYSNIELRKQGIIIRFQVSLKTLGWIIPFDGLAIQQSQGSVSVYGDGKFMLLKTLNKEPISIQFLSKIKQAKTNHTNRLYSIQ